MAAPIKETCPTIDKYIKSIKQEIVKERFLRNMNEKELYDSACAMSNELEYCIEYLEELRNSNDLLRQYGKQMEEEAESLQVYINELEEKIPLSSI